MAKSAKHRAIARERHEAMKAGTLPEWYASRKLAKGHEAWAEKLQADDASPTPSCAIPVALDTPYSPSPTFTRAYSQPQFEAAVWDERGYMHWQLDTCRAGSRLAVDRGRPNT